MFIAPPQLSVSGNLQTVGQPRTVGQSPEALKDVGYYALWSLGGALAGYFLGRYIIPNVAEAQEQAKDEYIRMKRPFDRRRDVRPMSRAAKKGFGVFGALAGAGIASYFVYADMKKKDELQARQLQQQANATARAR